MGKEKKNARTTSISNSTNDSRIMTGYKSTDGPTSGEMKNTTKPDNSFNLPRTGFLNRPGSMMIPVGYGIHVMCVMCAME